MNASPGDKITVRIDDRLVITTIDEHGVQRLPLNAYIKFLMEKPATDTPYSNHWRDLRDLGDRGSPEDRRQIYELVGYSLIEYSQAFRSSVIQNPLWGAPLTDGWYAQQRWCTSCTQTALHRCREPHERDSSSNSEQCMSCLEWRSGEECCQSEPDDPPDPPLITTVPPSETPLPAINSPALGWTTAEATQEGIDIRDWPPPHQRTQCCDFCRIVLPLSELLAYSNHPDAGLACLPCYTNRVAHPRHA